MSAKTPIVRYVARISYTYVGDGTVRTAELEEDKHGIREDYVGFIDAEEWERTGVQPTADECAAASVSAAFETTKEPQDLVDRKLEDMRRFPGLYADVQGWVAKVDIRRNLESTRDYHLKLVKELNAQLGEE